MSAPRSGAAFAAPRDLWRPPPPRGARGRAVGQAPLHRGAWALLFKTALKRAEVNYLVPFASWLGAVNGILSGNKVFADVTNLKRGCTGWGWTLNVTTGVFIRGRRRGPPEGGAEAGGTCKAKDASTAHRGRGPQREPALNLVLDQD